MKIGIISDTHTKVELARDAINMLVENGAEFLIHAGDIVEVEILEMLKNSGKRYIAVYGNNDPHLVHYHNKYNLVQEPHYFKLADTKFKLMHLPYYMSPDSEIVIFGHTHTFESDFKSGTLFLNPGEVCARSKPISECAMLEIMDSEIELVYYSKEKSSKKYKKQKFSYERESHE